MRSFNIIKSVIVLFIILFLLACTFKSTKPNPSANTVKKPENAGYMLMFSEMRPFEPESSVRMIITDDFLRIDEGPKSVDFILFNRKTKSIFNVVKDDESIMLIKPTEKNVEPPFPLRWVIKSETSQALMRTQNSNEAAATHYSYRLNDKPCYNLVTINNHLVETLDAMREYNLVLANELKSNYREMQGQECPEAMSIFEPNLRYQYGFPLREWSVYGYQRFLVDFQKDVIFPKSLFVLPKKYKIFTL